MERWNSIKSENVENVKIDAFLQEIIAICKKHGYSISHEDGHGAFEIENTDDHNFDWLLNAHDCTTNQITR